MTMRRFESTTPRLNNKYWTSLQKFVGANALAYSWPPFSTKKTSFISLAPERYPLRHQVPPGNKEIYSSLNKRSSLYTVRGKAKCGSPPCYDSMFCKNNQQKQLIWTSWQQGGLRTYPSSSVRIPWLNQESLTKGESSAQLTSLY